MERQKKEETRGWKSMSSLISVYTINCIYSSCLLLCIVSTFYALQFWRKMLWKLLVYMIHPPIVHVGITFQPSRPQSSWERCDKNILMIENWRERKMKKKKGQICSSRLILVYTTHPPIVHVSTKFQPSRPHSSWEKCGENFNTRILEKEKIKGRISSSLILVDSIHPPMSTCVPSFNLLGLTVPEKSVTKNFNVWKLERKKIKK